MPLPFLFRLKLTSYDVVFTFLSHHTTFEVVIDKIKLHIPSDLQPLNFDYSFVILFIKK
jgi:hypothetical protein